MSKSKITIELCRVTIYDILPKTMPTAPDPITPGEILLEEYLTPLGISQNALARALGVSPHTISEIVQARRGVTAEMSLRLGKFFHQSDDYWFNLQTICSFYELRKHAKEIVAPVKQDYRAVATQSAASKAAFETVAKTMRHRAGEIVRRGAPFRRQKAQRRPSRKQLA